MPEPSEIARPCPECGAPVGARCAATCASHETHLHIRADLFERYAAAVANPLLLTAGIR